MPKSKRQSAKPNRKPAIETQTIEIETAHGIEDICATELKEKLGRFIVGKPQTTHGTVRFNYSGVLHDFGRIRTANAAYLLENYPIPRPKAFLGHQHLSRLLAQIEQSQKIHGKDAYTTIKLGAAGSQSAVMQRLLEELAKATKLTSNADEGDMLVRLRPAAGRNSGWDALTRLSPRPIATRDWRVVNVGGALNAAVAHAMVLLSKPTPDDVVLNLACGSGTLVIERLLQSPAAQVLGCDTDPDMRRAAESNIEAANLRGQIDIYEWDATDVPLRSGSIDTIFADLPFGNLVGSHKDNIRLYPKVFDEAARLLKRDGQFIIITHEVKLVEAILLDTRKWTVQTERRVTLSGLHPRIFVLNKI